jgi:hypothetical protein
VSDLLLLALSAKLAQRRSIPDLAAQLHEPAPVVCALAHRLADRALARCWSDGQWGLTVAGNAIRNRLTARPLPHVRTIELQEAA